ncbi:MAG: hypothetical protein ACI8PT_003535 [Gammaproteobacteria bacterium]|jgi:hypothetical protein
MMLVITVPANEAIQRPTTAPKAVTPNAFKRPKIATP